MALIAKQPAHPNTPRVYEHPQTGDIHIGGMVYDRTTFTPKPYANTLVSAWDLSASSASVDTVLSDSNIILFENITASSIPRDVLRGDFCNMTVVLTGIGAATQGGFNCNNSFANSYPNRIGYGGIGNIVSGPRSIVVNRFRQKNDGDFQQSAQILVSNSSTSRAQTALIALSAYAPAPYRTDWRSRDWYEGENVSHLRYDTISDRYIGVFYTGNPSDKLNRRSGSVNLQWSGSGPGHELNKWNKWAFDNATANNGGYYFLGVTSNSALMIGPHFANNTVDGDVVRRIPRSGTEINANSGLVHTTDAVLNTAVADNSTRRYISLGKVANTAYMVLETLGGTTTPVKMYQIDDNTTTTLVATAPANTNLNISPYIVPSQAVRHGNTVSSNTKISYFFNASLTFGTSTLVPPRVYITSTCIDRIEFDVEAGTGTITACSITDTQGRVASRPNADAGHMQALVGVERSWVFDTRTIRAGTTANTQKYVMMTIVTGGMSADVTSAFTSDTAMRANNYLGVAVYKVDSANTRNLDIVEYTSWEHVLTLSPNKTPYSGTSSLVPQIPWCIAPLNPEHTKMMVFCNRSTHVVEFDLATERLQETWFDDKMIITGAMWLDGGKVITDGFEASKIGTTAGPSGYTEQHVWSDDLVYKVDLIPEAETVSYTGSPVNTFINVSTYNASNTRVSVDLVLTSTGNAVFANTNQSTITLTTSNSAHTNVAVIVSGPGPVSFSATEVID